MRFCPHFCKQKKIDMIFDLALLVAFGGGFILAIAAIGYAVKEAVKNALK